MAVLQDYLHQLPVLVVRRMLSTIAANDPVGGRTVSARRLYDKGRSGKHQGYDGCKNNFHLVGSFGLSCIGAWDRAGHTCRHRWVNKEMPRAIAR